MSGGAPSLRVASEKSSSHRCANNRSRRTHRLHDVNRDMGPRRGSRWVPANARSQMLDWHVSSTRPETAPTEGSLNGCTMFSSHVRLASQSESKKAIKWPLEAATPTLRLALAPRLRPLRMMRSDVAPAFGTRARIASAVPSRE